MPDDARDTNVLLREPSSQVTVDPPDRPVFVIPGIGGPRPRTDAAEARTATDPMQPERETHERTGADGRGVGWLNACLTLVALGGALVALTAPSLRPLLVERAPSVLGGSATLLADILTPETPAERAMADLLTRVTDLETGMTRLRMDVGNLAQSAARAEIRSVESGRSSAAAQMTAEDARLRVAQLEATSQILTERTHAASLLAAVTRLRRDIDAGGGLTDTIALLELNGPYPDSVAAAIDTLRLTPDGVPTMRDLALGFESLDQAITAEFGLEGTAWSRIRTLFGSSDDPRRSFQERVRAMAAEGRMSEVATMLAHSPWREQAAAWVAQVQTRTDAARAAQAIAAHALARAGSLRSQPNTARP